MLKVTANSASATMMSSNPMTTAEVVARHRQLEDACLRAADLVLAVSPTACAWLAARTTAPVELFTNGYEPRPDVQPAPRPGADAPQRLVYAGSLAYGRTLAPVLRAMARLRAEGVGPQRLRLTYVGESRALVAADAQAAGVMDAVDLHDQMPQAAALQAIDAALAAVVLVSDAFAYQYPGKIFDIVARHRPILLVGPPGCDAAELLARHRLGWTHAPEDIAGIAGSLRAALGGDDPRPLDVETLSAAAVMTRLADRLGALVGG